MNEMLRAESEKKIYLVPEQFNLEAERQLISQNHLDGLLNINVLSFDWLTQNIIKKFGGLKGVALDNFGQNMIIRRILEGNKDQLNYYQKSLNRQGLIEQFRNLILDINQTGLSYETLENLLTFEEKNYFNEKTRDLLNIYKHYKNFIKDHYVTPSDELSFVIEHLDQTDYLKDTAVWIDGFSHFSGLQKLLVERIMLLSTEVTIALTLDYDCKDQVPYQNIGSLFDELIRICKAHGLAYEVIPFNDFKNKKDSLIHLSHELFNFPCKPYTNELLDVSGYLGRNRNDEIELIAMKIKSLVKEQGYNYKDMAIITTALSDYEIQVMHVFERYDIPYFIDQKVSILNNPILQFIIGVLEMYNRHFQIEDVFKVIKTGFTELTKDEWETLENYVINYGIKGYLWESDFKRGQNKLSPETLEEINRIRRKFITPFLEFFQDISKEITDIPMFTRRFYRFINDYKLAQKLEDWVEILKAHQALEKINENTQIWNILMKILEEFVDIFDQDQLTLTEYIKILSEGFKEYEVGILPSLRDEILVGDLHRSKISNVKVLFVIGMNDGLFPTKIENNDLFSEEEKVKIKEKGLDFKNDLHYKIEEENYMTDQLFSKASDHVVLSYAIADEEGKSLRPSILIDQIKKIFPMLRFYTLTDILANPENSVYTSHSTRQYLIEALRRALDGYKIDEKWYDIYQWYIENTEDGPWILESLLYDNQLNQIDEGFTKALYDLPLKISASRLDSFIDCPFKHFVKYGLKASERQNYEVELPDIGILFHKSLENFSTQMQNENYDWETITQEESHEMIEDIIDEITTDYYDQLFLDNPRNEYYQWKIKRVLKKSIDVLKEHVVSGEFSPKAFELRFSDTGEGLKPVILNLDTGENIILTGTIDRLDTLEYEGDTYIKVIDYKSGNVDLRLSDIYHGTKSQLMIYLDALINDAEYFGFNHLKPAGLYYFKIDDPIVEYQPHDFVKTRILKEMKLSGLGVKDFEIMSRIDTQLKETSQSDILNVRLKKSGDFYSNSQVIDAKDFHLLRKHVRNKIKGIGKEILQGSVNIFPLKKSSQLTACSYCDYKGICQFDKQFSQNTYHELEKLSDKDVIKKLNMESNKSGD